MSIRLSGTGRLVLAGVAIVGLLPVVTVSAIVLLTDSSNQENRITISAWVSREQYGQLAVEYPLRPPPCEVLSESPDYDTVLTGATEMVKIPCDLEVD